ncbi:MAG: hypothetical protein ACE5JK_02270 [Candidatus Omnitrophota bacterium]
MKRKHILIIIALNLVFVQCLVSADTIKEKHDKQGNVVEKRYYREDGSLEQVEKFDELGHKIGIAYYGSSGNLREGADGWAAMRWKYQSGKIIAEGYYGADGRLKELKQYNKLGDLVAKKYVGDSNIDPNEEYNPVPPLAGETNTYYDSYGRKEGSTSISYDPEWFPDVWLLDDE